jgi:hypothetical protein
MKTRASVWFAFTLCLCLTLPGLAQDEGAGETPPVQGTFLGNGQEAALHHVVVLARDPWDDEKAFTVVVTEADPAGSKDPETGAMFGKLGHALIFQVTESGDLFGVQVCHQGLEKTSISSIGTTEIQDFQIAGGKLSARFVMAEEHEFFGDRWRFDLRVQAALP